jgi:hypothetical protein
VTLHKSWNLDNDAPQPVREGGAVDREIKPLDSYTAKILKLIPAEISAAYLSINSLVDQTYGFGTLMWIALLALALLCPFYLRIAGVQNMLQIGFSTLSFLLWAVNISASRLTDMVNPTALGVMLILWTMLIPLIPASAASPPPPPVGP